MPRIAKVLLVWLAVSGAAIPVTWAGEAPSTAPGGCPSPQTMARGDWITLAGYTDLCHRSTQFYRKDHDTRVLLADFRLELWAPPFRRTFSYGIYVRGSLIHSNRDVAFENALLAGPGVGIQVYPFSFRPLSNPGNLLGLVLGPLRLFVERNRLDYWGEENVWRPTEQDRFGFDYYLAHSTNRHTRAWWLETYHELIWRSANEFDDEYDSVQLANVCRLGVRVPHHKLLSWVTPYGIAESTTSENEHYAWENRLLLGGGLRLEPDLRDLPHECDWLSRLMVSGEYLYAAVYYRDDPIVGTPDSDWRAAFSVSVGEFWK